MLVSTRYGGDGRCDQCVKLGPKPNIALEENEELFRAARTLLSEGETNGDIIIPTLAYAAQLQRRPILKSVRDRLSEVEEETKAWEGLKSCFIRSCGALGPESVKNGTLLVMARPVAVLVWDPGGGVVENITVEVLFTAAACRNTGDRRTTLPVGSHNVRHSSKSLRPRNVGGLVLEPLTEHSGPFAPADI
jgi:hypothetical protein